MRYAPENPQVEPNRLNFTAALILEATNKVTGIVVDEIRGRRRTPNLAIVRAVVVYLARKRTDLVWKEISVQLLGRSPNGHSTALEALGRWYRQRAEPIWFGVSLERLAACIETECERILLHRKQKPFEDLPVAWSPPVGKVI